MLEAFYPKYYVSSAYVVPYETLYRRGIRGVIFDVDNTLVPHDAPADDRARKLFETFHDMGMETSLLSNNKEPRVAAFAGEVRTKYIYKGGKPSVKGYRRAMKLMGTRRETTVFVGDQIFTDVWGANRTGIRSIMLEKINPKEEIQIVLKRIPEKFVLWIWKKRNKK